MGRWSRKIAREFVTWLNSAENLHWLDIGCGTGALSATILERCAPRSLLGIDPSDGFVEHARRHNVKERARFEVAGAGSIPCSDRSIDVVTSALAYNFIPDRAEALSEMQRVVKPGGTVSFYVWDYPGGGIGFIDAFWKAAVALDPSAEALVEGTRFPFCTRDTLRDEATAAGLNDVTVAPIEIQTRFADFETFWRPFTRGAGPAPGYCLSLDEKPRQELKQRLKDKLGPGPIELPARAWAMKSVAQLKDSR
jgi:SAM-dependent methyltransferase